MFSLTADTMVDRDLLEKIRETGFSRVPIFLNEEGANRNAVVGVLLTKSLVGLQAPAADADSDDESKLTLADLMKSEQIKVVEPVYVTPESSLDSIFAMFRQGNVHCAIVTDQPRDMAQDAKASARLLKKTDDKVDATSVAKNLSQIRFTYHGIVTMENVVEGMLNMNIKDEKDLSRDPETSIAIQEAAAEDESFKPPVYSRSGPNNSLLVDEQEQVFRPTFFRNFVDAVKNRLGGTSGAAVKLASSSAVGGINTVNDDDEEIIDLGAQLRQLDGVDKEGGSEVKQQLKKKFDGQPAFGQQLRRNKKQKSSQLSQSLL